VLALVVLLAVGLVASLGGDGPGRRSARQRGAGPGVAGSARGAGPLSATERRRRLESRAITHVLGYTPFVSRGSPRKREVALTFDDGPGPLTPRFVHVLRHLRAPATFFVVGQQLNDFGKGLHDVIRAGFPVGDHTEQHPLLTRLSPAGQEKQIQDAALRIRSQGTHYPRLFRPPGGAFDAVTLRVLRRHRMLNVLWSADTRDYTRPGTQAIVQRAVGGARPGAIVLMHDGGGDRSQTLAALPAIVRRLRARHYRLVTVPQMLLHDPPRHQRRILSPGS
jgi:peptidoglycan/xylan/chitin deacetylase (PgdA/CDA1 family)